MTIIAVTYENGEIFQHFGHSAQFKIYTIENNAILSSKIIDNGESGHSALVDVLVLHNVDILICGGIGAGAKNMLTKAGITVYTGAGGDADSQIRAFLEKKINLDSDVTCNHHEDKHCKCH